MQNLMPYLKVVEEAISKIGIAPENARGKNTGQWTLKKGQIPVWIDVYYHQTEKRAYFAVSSPVMKMPEVNREQLAMELLELNNQLFGVAFVRKNENIFIKTVREADGMDVNEAFGVVCRILFSPIA